jgi:hypothetical protein
MQSNILSHRFNLTAAIGAALLLGSFATHAAGYKDADKTGASIAEFRDDIVSIKKAVDATMSALDKVVTQAAVDPRKAFKEFDKSVPKIDKAVATARKQSDEMKEKGAEYFKKWEADLAAVNNPDVKKLAEERKAKLQTTFGNIKNVMEPARAQFSAWLANVKDLQKYLSQDLTIAGVDAAKDLIAKTKTDGQGVQLTLDKVIAELNTVVATITPATAKK